MANTIFRWNMWDMKGIISASVENIHVLLYVNVAKNQGSISVIMSPLYHQTSAFHDISSWVIIDLWWSTLNLHHINGGNTVEVIIVFYHIKHSDVTSTSIPGGSLVDPRWIPWAPSALCSWPRRRWSAGGRPRATWHGHGRTKVPKMWTSQKWWMVGEWMWLMAMSNTAFSLGFSIFAIQGAESAAGPLQRQRDPPELCRPNRVPPGRSRPWDWWQGMKGMKGLASHQTSPKSIWFFTKPPTNDKWCFTWGFTWVLSAFGKISSEVSAAVLQNPLRHQSKKSKRQRNCVEDLSAYLEHCKTEANIKGNEVEMERREMPMLLEDPFLRQFQFKEPSSNPIHMFPSKKGRANNSLGGRGGGRRIPEIPCRRNCSTGLPKLRKRWRIKHQILVGARLFWRDAPISNFWHSFQTMLHCE